MKLDSLTSLRFFAAFSIFLHHVTPFGIVVSDYFFGLNLGWTVSFFFVLSGFVLSLSRDSRIHTRRDISNFILERFFRLWPLHVVCGVIALLTLSKSGWFEQYYLFFTLQHSWVPSYATAFFLNGVSWSISVELFFYIMFPFIFLMKVRYVVLFAIVWQAGVLALMSAASWHPEWFGFAPVTPNILERGVTHRSFFHLFPPIRLCEFVAGMLIYQLFKRLKPSPRAATVAQAVMALLLVGYMVFSREVFVFFWYVSPTIVLENFIHYGMYPLFAAFLLAFAYQEGYLAKALSHRVLVYLGEISFSFYMIHQIVITNINVHLGARAFGYPLMWVILAFIVSVAASAALFVAVEKPALNLVKQRLRAARGAEPAAA